MARITYDKQSFLEHHWDDTVGKWLGSMVSVLSRTIHEAIDICLAPYPSLSIYKYMYVCMNTSQLFFLYLYIRRYAVLSGHYYHLFANMWLHMLVSN